jgi:hypothetical protein
MYDSTFVVLVMFVLTHQACMLLLTEVSGAAYQWFLILLVGWLDKD